MIYAYHKSDELYHHGILGQEWGKKNGPPYPLDAEDHSAAEKKALGESMRKFNAKGRHTRLGFKTKEYKQFKKDLQKRVSQNMTREEADEISRRDKEYRKAERNYRIERDNNFYARTEDEKIERRHQAYQKFDDAAQRRFEPIMKVANRIIDQYKDDKVLYGMAKSEIPVELSWYWKDYKNIPLKTLN